MQTCDDVRHDLSNTQDKTDVLALYDSNHDMKITKDEFISAHGNMGNSVDAFDFIQSVFIQADTLGKPHDEGSAASHSSIELGRFFRLNWGWREFLTSGGGIAYPWRVVLENTMGSGLTSNERVKAFKQANFVLSNLIIALKDQDKYPSKTEMEEKLFTCKSNANHESQQIVDDCFEKIFYAGSSVVTSSSSNESIFGFSLAYPSQWKPEKGSIYESKSLQVARCLVVEGSLSYSDFAATMGCKSAKLSHTSEKNEVDHTAEILAWTFGALFICSLLGLAYTFFWHLPKKLKQTKPGSRIDHDDSFSA